MRLWWLKLTNYGRPHLVGLLLIVLLVLTGVAVSALMPWPLKLIVDYVLKGEPFPQTVSWITMLPGGPSSTALLGWLVASTVVLFVCRHTVTTVQSYIENGIGIKMTHRLGADLFDHLQRLSVRFHSQQSSGDLLRRVTTDSRCVRELVMGVFIPLLTSLASLTIMFFVMWKLNPSLSSIALLVALPLPVLIKLLTPRMTERTYKQQQLEGQMMSLAEQALTAVPVVQAFGREEYEDRRFRTLSRRTIRAYLRALSSQLQFKIGVSAAIAVGTAAILAIGGLHVLRGSMSVGSLLVFLAYLASLYAPIETLAYLSTGYASAAARARRVMEVLEAEDLVRDTVGARSLPPRPEGERGHVCLEGVTFGYEPDRPVLRDVTLVARPGETVALVGPTGAGKSTLVSLILRLFDPWQGRVIIDGMDVRDVKLSSLRANVALVLQEPFLLPLTVEENIAYGRPTASREDIVAAAVAANAHEFIRELPEGYDTVIGERGATLSGGQKQRLAIARALLKNAPVLILDEPTSALDAETESQLLEALERLMAGRTTFIIAHRLSTIRAADRIVVLDQGRIVEVGTQLELLATGGHYYRFYALQNASAATYRDG
jgi:ATP-binding cassette subfamily B protein/subfamily B ATP-binding cassette protein MsbA